MTSVGIALKNAVHKILGEHGQIICSAIIRPDVPLRFEATWKRDYGDDGLSDERPRIEADSVHGILGKILDYEQRADEKDAENTAASNEEVSRSMF